MNGAIDRLRILLGGRPDNSAWAEICGLLEGLSPEELADVTPSVLAWPGAIRTMPDGWWDQWSSGEVLPHHALAGRRHLGDLDNVECGTVPTRRALSDSADDVGAREDEEEEEDDDEDEDEAAYFYHGATTVGCGPGLRWLVVGAAAEWHHNGGDIVRWSTTGNASLGWLLNGGDYHDEAYDLQISPDGKIAVSSVEGELLAWSTGDGSQIWGVDAHDDGNAAMENIVRIGFSSDGSRVAFGTTGSGHLAVLDVATGEPALDIASDAFGPVSLDATGQLLAHAGPAGQVAVREVPSGDVLLTIETGLHTVNALAIAPDRQGIFAVGGAVGGAPQSLVDQTAAGTSTDPHPAACVISLEVAPDKVAVTSIRQLRPGAFPSNLDAGSPFATMATRAVWTERGPYGFFAADFGAMLIDGEGRTIWAAPSGLTGNFALDGSALVTVGQEIDAWFLAGLTPPPAKAGDADPRTLEAALLGPPSPERW